MGKTRCWLTARRGRGDAALGAFAGRGLRAAVPARALAFRRVGLPQKLAGYQRQLVEGAGRWCGVGWEVAGHEAS